MTQRPGLGIALILFMAACFATMDTTVKFVGALVPVLVVLWARYGVQAAVMALWLARSSRRGGAGFRSAHPRFQAVRGVLLLAVPPSASSACNTCRWPSSPPSPCSRR
ncbi:MAG: hypothetical protein U1E80_05745 [Piscinibacter sp.]